MSTQNGALEALLQEERRFPPSDAFRAGAPHVTDPDVYAEAERDPESYWARWAEELDWYEP